MRPAGEPFSTGTEHAGNSMRAALPAGRAFVLWKSGGHQEEVAVHGCVPTGPGSVCARSSLSRGPLGLGVGRVLFRRLRLLPGMVREFPRCYARCAGHWSGSRLGSGCRFGRWRLGRGLIRERWSGGHRRHFRRVDRRGGGVRCMRGTFRSHSHGGLFQNGTAIPMPSGEVNWKSGIPSLELGVDLPEL